MVESVCESVSVRESPKVCERRQSGFARSCLVCLAWLCCVQWLNNLPKVGTARSATAENPFTSCALCAHIKPYNSWQWEEEGSSQTALGGELPGSHTHSTDSTLGQEHTSMPCRRCHWKGEMVSFAIFALSPLETVCLVCAEFLILLLPSQFVSHQTWMVHPFFCGLFSSCCQQVRELNTPLERVGNQNQICWVPVNFGVEKPFALLVQPRFERREL